MSRLLTLAAPTHYYHRYHEPETTLEDLKGHPAASLHPIADRSGER